MTNSGVSTKQLKLHPVWHLSTLKDSLPSLTYNFDIETLPDYGGVGVDISPANTFENTRQYSLFDCHSLKNEMKQDNSKCFSRRISLPFLPPNKYFKEEPCLKNVEKLLHEQTEFANKLLILRKKAVSHEIYLNSLQKYLKNNLLLKTEAEKDFAVPESYCLMADIYEKKRFPAQFLNRLYNGGCLKVNQQQHLKAIIHPGGKHLNQIVSTFIQENQSSGYHSNFSAMKELRINLKDGGLIYQIEQREKENEEKTFLGVRQKTNSHFVFLDLKNEKFELLESFHFENELQSSIALSPYVAEEMAILNSNGTFKILSVNQKRNPIWENKSSKSHRSSDFDNNNEFNFCQCSFGAHPRSILLLNENSLTSSDIRSKRAKESVLFNLKCNERFNYKWDQLSTFLRNPRNEFQHFLASKHHLYLIDERYANQPIFVWNHLLESSPFYMEMLFECKQSNVCKLFLASQKSAEICCFNLECPISCSGNSPQPISLNPPWHIKNDATNNSFRTSNTIEQILNKLKNCDKSSLAKRISTPLIGLAALPTNYQRNEEEEDEENNGKGKDKGQEQSWSLFRLNSVGDVFSQDFGQQKSKEIWQLKSTDEEEKDWQTMELETYSNWMESFQNGQQSKFNSLKATCWLQEELLDVKSLYSLALNEDEKSFPTTSGGSSQYCPICFPQEETTTLLDENLKCSGCGLNVELATNVVRVRKQGSVLSTFDLSNCRSQFEEEKYLNLINLKSNFDPFSNSMMKVWSEPPEEVQNEESLEDEETVLRELLFPKSSPFLPNPPTENFLEELEITS